MCIYIYTPRFIYVQIRMYLYIYIHMCMYVFVGCPVAKSVQLQLALENGLQRSQLVVPPGQPWILDVALG